MTNIITPDKDWVASIEPGEGIWITVAHCSVNIKHGDDGVSVTLYPVGQEDRDSLSEAWATHDECKPEET